MSTRLIGDTQQCFDHLMAGHPEIAVLELIAEFCDLYRGDKVDIAVVQRWQRKAYFPNGELLVRLRCFLHLAGYEVTELMQLNATARSLAYLVSLNLVDPSVVAQQLGYRKSAGLSSLWRILVQGGNYHVQVGKEMGRLHIEHHQDLDARTASWSERITEIIGEPSAPAEITVSILQVDPVIATAFARSVAAAASLGQYLLANDAKSAALAATRGGADIHELTEILHQLSLQAPSSAQAHSGAATPTELGS